MVPHHTDGDGFPRQTGKDSVDIHPNTSTLNFGTVPPGLQILLDGQPLQTPASVVSVEGMIRTIGVITPQIKDEVTHIFESWSNEGTTTQTLVTPADNLSLTAQFSVVVDTETNEGNELFSIFQNPSRGDHVMLRIISPKAQFIQLRMVDLLFRNISFHEEELHIGENNFPFYFGRVSEGIYLLLLELGVKTISKRLVVSD